MDYRRYLILLVTGTIVLSAAIALLNAVVDPFDIYRLVNREGLNANKTEYHAYARIAKPIQIERHQYERLAFGSSRVDIAIPVEYGQWARDYPHGFNAGLNAASLQSILEVLEHATDVSDVRDVLIGIDFYMFNGMNQGAYLNPEMLASLNPNPWNRHWQQWSMTLFSPGALSATIATLRHQDEAMKRKPTGQADMDNQITKARENGYEAMFRVYEDGLVRHVWTPCRDNRFAYHYKGSPDSLAMFQQILNLAETRGFRLTLFIAPVHARMLEVLDASGLWADYEQWKRDMTAMAADSRTRGGNVTLWDFSGYHAYATEPVPTDPTATMQWYIDSSHYTQALAERMLDEMYSHVAGFGTRLEPANVEAHLASLRTGRDAYRAAHTRQYATLAERTEHLLAEKARNGFRCPDAVTP